MKIKITKRLLFSVVISFLVAGCYKDKGNYDLAPINEIIIDTLVKGVDNIDILLGDTLYLAPQVKQANVQNGSYSYRWFMNRDDFSPTIELSDKKDLNIPMVYPLGSYTLLYRVTDQYTHISTTQQTHITIASKYSSGIVVLEEGTQGGDLSQIQFDGRVYRNLYSMANNKLIPKPVGKIKGLYYATGYWIQKTTYMFIAGPGREATELDPESYTETGPFSRLMGSPPTGIIQLMDIQGQANMPYCYAIVNGKLQFSSGVGEYMPVFQGALLGDYELASYIFTSTDGGGLVSMPDRINFIGYDQKNGRFVWYSSANVGTINTYSTGTPGAFDPNNVKKECVYACYSDNLALFTWLMKDGSGKMYVYQMAPLGTLDAARTYTEIPALPEMRQATIFAGSTQLPHIYYVADNKVYIYDYKANASHLVYSFSDGEQITDMTFAVSRIPDYATSYQTFRTLDNIYIATYNGTEGKVHEFGIAGSGSFTGNAPVRTFSGFGKISSLFYKERN